MSTIPAFDTYNGDKLVMVEEGIIGRNPDRWHAVDEELTTAEHGIWECTARLRDLQRTLARQDDWLASNVGSSEHTVKKHQRDQHARAIEHVESLLRDLHADVKRYGTILGRTVSVNVG